MKNITDIITQSFTPTAVLVAYKKDSGYSGENYYLETRPVKKDGSLGAAKPVSIRFVQKLATSFSGKLEVRPHGIMPANMLFADSRIGVETYIWWTAPGKRKLFFSKDTGMEEGEYNLPGCIFVANKEKLYVFCFEGYKPFEETKLLYGPFYNYYDDGHLCLGNAHTQWPKEIKWKDIQEHWEKLFWASENSHTITNPLKDGAILAVELNQSRNRPFNTKVLKETNLTLEQLIKKYDK